MPEFIPSVGDLDNSNDPAEADTFYLRDDLPLVRALSIDGRLLRQFPFGAERLDYDHDLIALARFEQPNSDDSIVVATFKAFRLEGITIYDQDAGVLLLHSGGACKHRLPSEALIAIYTVTFRGPQHGAIQSCQTVPEALTHFHQAVTATAHALADMADPIQELPPDTEPLCAAMEIQADAEEDVHWIGDVPPDPWSIATTSSDQDLLHWLLHQAAEGEDVLTALSYLYARDPRRTLKFCLSFGVAEPERSPDEDTQ